MYNFFKSRVYSFINISDCSIRYIDVVDIRYDVYEQASVYQ